MTDKQPEALRLAETLEATDQMHPNADLTSKEVAAELRRLLEAHDWQYKMAGDRLRRIEKLERVNAQLLEALEHFHDYGYDREMGHAAIAAAKETA